MRYEIIWPQKKGEPNRPPSMVVSRDGTVIGGSPTFDWAHGMSIGEVLWRLRLLGGAFRVIDSSCEVPNKACVITRRAIK